MESDDHNSDLQDNETGLKKDAYSLLDQELTVLDMMLSKCSQNDTLSHGKSKYLVSYVIEKKNENDYPRNANGHKLSLYELYHLVNVESIQLHLKIFNDVTYILNTYY